MRALSLPRLLPLLLLALLAACSTLPPPQEASQFPILDDGKLDRDTQKVIVVIPGAMASIGIFNPVFDWDVPNSAKLAYRFPGMDQLPLDHQVDIDKAAEIIAEVLNAYETPEVYLIGYSTGGPIALETARRLNADKVSLALISSASNAPAAEIASISGFWDVVKAMVRSGGGSLDDALAENYRTLLYGRHHYADPAQAAKSAQQAKGARPKISAPRAKLTLAHTSDLMTWHLKRDPKLADAHIAFFHGQEDSVFSPKRTQRFAGTIPADKFFIYPGQGHLLFATSKRMWSDIRHFFELD